jgi:predicted HTH transcriptional regulator
MDVKELQRLVLQGEGAHLEFKRKVADAVKISKEAVAFANHQGGKIIIGVNDDGAIPGLKHPEEEAFLLDKALKQHCKPALDFSIEYVPLNWKKQVVVFHIEEAVRKPVFLIYNLRTRRGRAYIRVADKSVQASREVRQILRERHREQHRSFAYGEKERFVMRYLAEYPAISLQQFVEAARIRPEEASLTLVQLTVSNVLELHPGDDADLYTLKEQG